MVRIATENRGTVQFTGRLERTLAGLAGAEVWVAGAQRNTAERVTIFEPTEFAVRAVDGVGAADGVLTSHGGALSLTLATGTFLPLRSAPDALRAHTGKRVWVTLANGDVQSFGVIPDR